MVRAVLKKGAIQPVDEIPESWSEGQDLVVDSADPVDEARPDPEEIRAWAREIEEAARRIPQEEHERFRRALAEHKEEAKQFVRRQMGLP